MHDFEQPSASITSTALCNFVSEIPATTFYVCSKRNLCGKILLENMKDLKKKSRNFVLVPQSQEPTVSSVDLKL